MQIAARYLEAVLRRLNQAPARNELAFLDLLGVELVPARGARAPLAFTLADKAPDSRLPAGTRVAAPPPPGRTDQVIFETERPVGLAAARLQQVVSLWPGRDQYIDHSAAFQAGQALTLFDPVALQDTPHALYLAHDVLLALAGTSTVDVRIELPTPSSQPLDLVWEYWDGTTWREFLDMRPECDLQQAEKLDGTDQLRRSGQYRLQTDCAETSKVAVGGITAFWVRARLDVPLPPDPARILPEIDVIQLSTEVIRPVNIAWTRGPVTASGTAGSLQVQVTDEVGTPLRGVPVSVDGRPPVGTDVGGTYTSTVVAAHSSAAVTMAINGVELEATVNFVSSGDTQAQFQLLATGLAPDKAFVNTVPVDLTKPFAALGPAPQAGDALYFSSAEAFAKPGARLTVYVQTAPVPADQLLPSTPAVLTAVRTARRTPAARTARAAAAVIPASGAQPMVHGVSWEYWDGRAWTSVHAFTSTPSSSTPGSAADDLTGTGVVELVVPDDMATTAVNGQDGLWMRVRLTSGGYGFTQQVTLQSGGTFVYVVPQPPTLSKLLLGYTWQKGPLSPEHVLAYNDFQYQDRTEEATWPFGFAMVSPEAGSASTSMSPR